MSTFILGLDLGQTNDYSALIVAEQIMPEPATPPADTRPRYDVRHIERFPLGTPYPAIVDATVETLERPELGDNVFLVIDGTGVGRAPVDMFRARIGQRAHPVTIRGRWTKRKLKYANLQARAGMAIKLSGNSLRPGATTVNIPRKRPYGDDSAAGHVTSC